MHLMGRLGLLGLLGVPLLGCASGGQRSLEDLYEENRSDLGGGSEADQAEAPPKKTKKKDTPDRRSA